MRRLLEIYGWMEYHMIGRWGHSCEIDRFGLRRKDIDVLLHFSLYSRGAIYEQKCGKALKW